MTQYQGDALFGPCPNGGDIEFVGGDPRRSGGLSGAVYISMFGGNSLDAGDPDSTAQWWGNYLESDTNKRIHGRTGTLVAGIPMAGSNLARIEEAALRDLDWMVTLGVATSVEVSTSIESARDLLITVTVQAQNTELTFVYRENWLAGLTEPAQLPCA